MKISYADSGTYVPDSDQKRDSGSQKTNEAATNVGCLSHLIVPITKKARRSSGLSDERERGTSTTPLSSWRCDDEAPRALPGRSRGAPARKAPEPAPPLCRSSSGEFPASN